MSPFLLHDIVIHWNSCNKLDIHAHYTTPYSHIAIAMGMDIVQQCGIRMRRGLWHQIQTGKKKANISTAWLFQAIVTTSSTESTSEQMPDSCLCVFPISQIQWRLLRSASCNNVLLERLQLQEDCYYHAQHNLLCVWVGYYKVIS